MEATFMEKATTMFEKAKEKGATILSDAKRTVDEYTADRELMKKFKETVKADKGGYIMDAAVIGISTTIAAGAAAFLGPVLGIGAGASVWVTMERLWNNLSDAEEELYGGAEEDQENLVSLEGLTAERIREIRSYIRYLRSGETEPYNAETATTIAAAARGEGMDRAYKSVEEFRQAFEKGEVGGLEEDVKYGPETLKAVQESEAGENMEGPFKSVDEAWEHLQKTTNDESETERLQDEG